MNDSASPFEAYVYALIEQIEQHVQGLDELAAVAQHRQLTFNERSAAERSLQVLTETSIGAGKHFLKSRHVPVPSEARMALERVYELLNISAPPINVMRGAVALRNAIIHDYLNLDWARILPILTERRYLDIERLTKRICDALMGKDHPGNKI